MKGYWGNPKATAEIKTGDGWLQTGDIAHRDTAGKWYIVDRKKVCFENSTLEFLRAKFTSRRS